MLRLTDIPFDFRREVADEVSWPVLGALAPDAAPRPTTDILAINRVGFMGGVERVLLSAAQALAERGWSTALACPAGGLAAEARANGMPLYLTELGAVSRSQIGRSLDGWLRLAARARRSSEAILGAARSTRARIIHVHHPAVAVQARKAAHRLKTPMIWHVHETAPMSVPYRFLGTIAAHSSALVICVSKASRDMVRELGAPEHRIRLVYNAADPGFFAPVLIDAEPWPPGPHIGLFAVLEPRKGHADLIRALAIASAVWPTLQLWIVGETSFERHADYKAALERLAQGLGVADRVHFTGRRTDVPQLMARMDAIVSASVCSESLPTALIEACAMGRPTVGTDVGGTCEIIRNRQNGVLVPPGSPHQLASAIEFVLSPNGAVLGRRARADAQRRFSPARFASALEDCYRELIAEESERVG
jgi:glycosyltransferase involved in cell wall biosynthesis